MSQLWPWRSISLLPVQCFGQHIQALLLCLYLTEVKVAIIWVLLALRPPLMIGLNFKPAAFSTPEELTSVKTRQSTTYKSSPGLGLLKGACFMTFCHMCAVCPNLALWLLPFFPLGGDYQSLHVHTLLPHSNSVVRTLCTLCVCFWVFFVCSIFRHITIACTTFSHIGKLTPTEVFLFFFHRLRKKTQQGMSVCGGLGFISKAKPRDLHFSDTSSFMSAPWCCSVRNYFSGYTKFWKAISSPCASPFRSFFCAPSLFFSVSWKHTQTHSHRGTHIATCIQPDMHNHS